MKKKIKLGPNARAYATVLPTIIVGANKDNKPNYSTIANCGMMCTHTPTIYISSFESHRTNEGIFENNTFSLNIPSANIVKETDYCGIVSGKKIDKSDVFSTFYGELESAPMIEECPVNLECKVVTYFKVHDMDVFVAEIVESYIVEEYWDGNKPILDKIKPLVYGFDRNYWDLGQIVDAAFKSGKDYRKNIK